MASCKTCKYKKLIGNMCGCDGVYNDICYMPKKRSPTNADRIRSMSDEELAEWILQLVDCGKENVMCNPTEYKLSGKCNGRCLQGRLDWLIQPAGEGQDNA